MFPHQTPICISLRPCGCHILYFSSFV
jgi:hypothetical protein